MCRVVLACCLALALAGCGADEERPAAADPDQPVSSSPDPSPAPAGDPPAPKLCRKLGQQLVGGPIGDGMTRAELRGCTLRIAVLDGEGQALTDDFQPARINLRVADGVVVRVEFMG